MVLTFCLLLLGSGVFSPDLQYTVLATPLSPDAWSLIAQGNHGEPAIGAAWGSRLSLVEPYTEPGLLAPFVRVHPITADLSTGMGVLMTREGWQVPFRPMISPGACP